MSKWLALIKTLAPIILTSVKPELAPIAGQVTDAINEAEQMKGASGPQKLQHVKNIAQSTVNALNTARGKEVISASDLNAAITSAVSTTVDAINLIHKRSEPVK